MIVRTGELGLIAVMIVVVILAIILWAAYLKGWAFKFDKMRFARRDKGDE